MNTTRSIYSNLNGIPAIVSALLALVPVTQANSPTDSRVEDVAFIAKCDGTTQRYVKVTPQGYQGDRPIDILIALHGHGSDRWQFVRHPRSECRATRDIARKYGMLLISPDYRAKTSWMGPKAEADVVQIIRELKQSHRVRHVIISGGSMGGTASLTFAALHPDLVHGVASMNGTANLVQYENFQDAIARSYGGTKTQVPDEYHKRSAELHADKLTMPVACTTGGRDRSVPPDSVIRLTNVLKAKNRPALLIHRETGGHATNYDDAIRMFEFVITQVSSNQR